jgi:hypothetical protein
MRFTRQHWASLESEDRIAWFNGEHGPYSVVEDNHPEAIPVARVYNSGHRVHEYRMPETLDFWVTYNKEYRPGNKLEIRGERI